MGLVERFCGVDKKIDEVDAEIEQVRVAVGELRDKDVSELKLDLGRIEKQVVPLKADAARSALGVDLLCEVVAISGLMDNAESSLRERLTSFISESTASSTSL